MPTAVAKLFDELLAKDWAQFDAERAAGGWKGSTAQSKSPAARARLTRLKNEYARVGREEGWDSPEAKAAEQKMLAAQRRFGTVKRLAKDTLTVGDVHVSAAAGSKRKAKLFSAVNGGKVKTLPANVGKIARICKVDSRLGIVFGYAIVCKINGEDYYDLNIDPDGERVPEHIPEESMLDASTDFMLHSRVCKDMHHGDEDGPAVFAFPLTTDIAAALDITAKKTGLLFAMKPSKEVLAKFESGDYTGLSIGGYRIENENVD